MQERPGPASGPGGLPATATSAPGTARRAFARLVDPERAAVHLEAVELLDGGLGLGRSHVDEGETARLAGLAIIDDLHRIDLAVLLEQGANLGFGCAEGHVANIESRHRRNHSLGLGRNENGFAAPMLRTGGRIRAKKGIADHEPHRTNVRRSPPWRCLLGTEFGRCSGDGSACLAAYVVSFVC